MQLRDGSPITLHDVKSPYTLLYFWRYDCGHCKESMPDLKAFYEEYKNKFNQLFLEQQHDQIIMEMTWEHLKPRLEEYYEEKINLF